MLVNCIACQKKFKVPDSAVTEAGRLLQCGSCGNKWTQYPIKEKLIKEFEREEAPKVIQAKKVNRIKTLSKKKKREVNLYSEEYLRKKHGLVIKKSLGGKEINKNTKKSFNFFNYLLIINIFIITLFGILNLLKDSIILKYPFVEPYVNNLYQVFNIIKIKISNLIN